LRGANVAKMRPRLRDGRRGDVMFRRADYIPGFHVHVLSRKRIHQLARILNQRTERARTTKTNSQASAISMTQKKTYPAISCHGAHRALNKDDHRTDGVVWCARSSKDNQLGYFCFFSRSCRGSAWHRAWSLSNTVVSPTDCFVQASHAPTANTAITT